MGAEAGRRAAAAAAARRCRQRHLGHRACRPIVGSTATPPARFGITPATVDNALYDAFGQRIVSTIFTQSNQYRVILEADPALQNSLQSLERHLPAVLDRRDGQVPLSAIAKMRERDRAAADQPSRPVPGDDGLVQPRARRLARRAVDAIKQARAARSACRPASSPASRARRSPSRPRSPTSCC